MESSNTLNDFLGSNLFSVAMIIAVIALGFILRLTFSTPSQYDKEYKHNPRDLD